MQTAQYFSRVAMRVHNGPADRGIRLQSIARLWRIFPGRNLSLNVPDDE